MNWDLLNRIIQIRTLVIASFTVVTIGIMLLTLLPPNKLGSSGLYQYDLAGHFFIFLIWTFLLGSTFISVRRKKAPLLLIFFAGCLFGISIEVAQEITQYGRNADLYDTIADMLGSLVAVLMVYLIQMKITLVNNIEPN